MSLTPDPLYWTCEDASSTYLYGDRAQFCPRGRVARGYLTCEDSPLRLCQMYEAPGPPDHSRTESSLRENRLFCRLTRKRREREALLGSANQLARVLLPCTERRYL